ncbi:MAG: hypothetical protein NVSMB51_02830 [Solirubrobacteraceae bacterium]
MSELGALERPRSLVELVEDSFGIYRLHIGVLLLLSGGFSVIVGVILAIGLGDLTAAYGRRSPRDSGLLTVVAAALVTTPLVAAMMTSAVLDVGAGRRPQAKRAVSAGLDIFAPLLGAVLIYGALVLAGMLAFVLPGLYVAVLCFFVAQAVVIDGRRGTQALVRSAELVAGRWWRTLRTGIAFYLLVAVPGFLVALVFDALARAANSQALVVAGNIVYDTAALPLMAIGATLYYLELRAHPRER